MSTPKRRVLQLKLSDEEWQNFQIRAIRANMKVAQYLRYLMLTDDERNFKAQKMRERIQELSGNPYSDNAEVQ